MTNLPLFPVNPGWVSGCYGLLLSLATIWRRSQRVVVVPAIEVPEVATRGVSSTSRMEMTAAVSTCGRNSKLNSKLDRKLLALLWYKFQTGILLRETTTHQDERYKKHHNGQQILTV